MSECNKHENQDLFEGIAYQDNTEGDFSFKQENFENPGNWMTHRQIN